MAADSQSEVPTEEAEETVSTENLPSNIVQTKPCKKKKKILASHLLLSSHMLLALVHISKLIREMPLLSKLQLLKGFQIRGCLILL